MENEIYQKGPKTSTYALSSSFARIPILVPVVIVLGGLRGTSFELPFELGPVLGADFSVAVQLECA